MKQKFYLRTMDYPDGNYIIDINADSDKTVAIYGDSFGDGYVYPDSKGVTSKGAINIESWWPTILARKMQVKRLHNFCAGGSPFYFTYETFLNNYKDYDINIVLVTEPFRYTKKVKLPTVQSGNTFYGSNVNQLEYYKKTYDLMPFEKSIIDDLVTWHMVKDKMYMDTAHRLMIDHIERLTPSTLIIPCFKHSYNLNNGLNDFLSYQLDSLNITYNDLDKYTENKEVMSCHFTPEMNKVVAERVLNRLNTGQWDWSDPKIVHEHPVDYYYKK